MQQIPRALAGLTLLVALTNLVVWWTASTDWLAKNNSHGFMAVSTATGFAVLGLVLLLRLVFAKTRWAQIMVWVAAVLLAVAGLHVVIGRASGQSVRWEAWLNSAGPVLNDVVQMQFATAVLLILSAFSLWALTLGESRLPWVKETGVVVAAIIGLLSFLGVLSAVAGNPMFSRTELLKMGIFAALDFCIFNCALLLSVSHTGRLRRLFFGVREVEDLPPLLRDDRTAFGILGLASMVILSGIVVYLRFQTEQVRRRVGGELQVAAELKSEQLIAWIQERRKDARALASMPDLPRILDSLTKQQIGAERRAELVHWLQTFARIYDYERVVLLDTTMTPMLAGDAGTTPSAAFLQAELHAAPGGQAGVLMLPPTANEADELCLDFLAPLPGPAGQAPIGAVLLQSKPSRTILPMLQVWPYGNQTGQFVLWQRLGQRLYSLGGYRTGGPTDADRRPFSQVRDLNDPNLLIARVAAGETALLEGTDVRGIPILGLGRRLADTNWLLSCRMDASELYAPLRRSAWQVVGMTLLVFGGIGFFITRRLRHRQLDLLRERAVAELAEKRAAARLGAVLEHARDVMLLLNSDLRIVEANQCAVDTYGWSAEELCRMDASDLRSAASRSDFERISARVRQNAGDTFEAEHRRKDGAAFPVEASTSRVEIDGRTHYFSIIRDITERKRAEEALRATEERYRLIAESTSDIIWLTDLRTGVFTYVSPALEPTLGWLPTEAVGRRVGDFVRTADDMRVTIQARVAAFNAGDMTQRHKRYELELRHRDGSFKVAESSSSILPDANGQAAMLLTASRDISERRRAEAALRESEERYRLIAENTSDVIWLADLRTGVFTYVSAAIQPTLGWRPEDMVGQQVGVFSNEKGGFRRTIEARAAAFNAGDQSKRYQRDELELRHQDGSLRHADVSSTILPGAAGQAETLLGVSRDITERKRAEIASRASEERYRLIAENTSDVIWLYDFSKNGFSYVSAAAFPVLGYQPEELVGRSLTTTLTEAAEAKARQLLQQLIAEMKAGGQRQHTVVELEQRRKDGYLIPTEVTASLLPDPSGEARHILGITRDITERRRAQEVLEQFNVELEEKVEQRTAELAARNQETQMLLDALPDTVLLCDERGEFVFGRSVRYPGVTGLVSGATVPGSRPVLDGEIRRIVREMHGAVRTGQAALMREFECRVEDERLIDLEANAAPIGTERVLILLRDISARKRLERGVLANLDREKQLSEMKSQFISVASHEFRTPLAAAVGSLELLERHAAKLTESKRVELLARIQKSLGRLTAIMNDVLQLSRADSGRVKVKRMDVDLGQFVQDIIHEVQAGDGEKHRFEFHRTGGTDVVPVDQSLVNHILSNLVGNAVRYSPVGTAVTVHLEIAAEAFTLRVVDEGIGIPEADRDRVFEPFARGSNVGQIGGTGLGLNIVKRYTELMGGRIELLPSTRGAVFQVTVPLQQPSS